MISMQVRPLSFAKFWKCSFSLLLQIFLNAEPMSLNEHLAATDELAGI
jgi:hypothetical protein